MTSKPTRRERTDHKAALWDALCARALAVKLKYPNGRLTVETNDGRSITAVLTRVLGVLTSPEAE